MKVSSFYSTYITSLKNSTKLIWIYVLYVLGICFFLNGFLLKRVEIHQNSTMILNLASDVVCHNFSSLQSISSIHHSTFPDLVRHPNPQKHMTNKIKRFQKSVLIVIDALRYDFAAFSDQLTDENVYYTNKLTIFSELLANFSRNSLLIRFKADAPTTTLQRLKALMTGSLPTFIDVSSNFASNQVNEDNLIFQMHAKKIVFMGDETWESLFPDQFHRTFSYPSFNIKDLDTVDNGILDNIYSEMAKDDWDVIIAHFLGVDHCGHRFGPKHPAMEKKLLQMDAMLRKVITLLKEDTILFVIGDHGMTETGDHGGESTDETSTVLFAYSMSYIVPEIIVKNVNAAAQIDLVPTFSLLLGLPIPFSNLGSVLPQIFFLEPSENENVCFHEELDALIGSTLALAENTVQVHRYVYSYMKVSGEFPPSILENAEAVLNKLPSKWESVTENVNQSKLSLKSLCDGYMEYLSYIRNQCESRWAVFNLEVMLLGLIILLLALLFNFLLAGESLSVHKTEVLHFIVRFSIAVTILILYFKHAFILLYLCIYLILCRKYVWNFVSHNLVLFGYEFIITFIISLSLFSIGFSNSFVVYEDSIILFLLQTAIICAYFPFVLMVISTVFFPISEKTKKKKFLNKKVSRINFVPLLILGCLLFCIRLGFMFHKCREEQFCISSSFLISLENLSFDSPIYRGMRLMLSLSAVILPTAAIYHLIKYDFLINSSAILLFCSNYAIPFASVCTCLHWWLSMAPNEVVEKILNGNQVILTHCVIFTSLFVLVSAWLFPMISDKPWMLTTEKVYSGSLSLSYVAVLQTLYLVAGDGTAPAMSFIVVSIMLFLSLERFAAKMIPNKSESRSWLNSLVWCILSCHWFYGTGHQQTFPAIQWHAAFLLQKNISNYILSGGLVLINTFSSQILCGIALPFLFIWSHSSKDFDKTLLKVVFKYLLFHGIKLFGASLSCWILRRHLMVWKIFAPKLVYEAASMLVTIISVAIGYLFTLRITSVYHYLIQINVQKLWSSKDY